MYSALYYPHIAINDNNLIRNALLLWDKLEYITPFKDITTWNNDEDYNNALSIISEPHVPSDEEKESAHETILDFAKKKWDIFCDQFPTGTHISTIEKKLEGLYRDHGTYTWGGTGRKTVYFLIDDFFQLCVDVDYKDKTIGKCIVIKRQLWTRFPDGQVVMRERKENYMNFEIVPRY